MPSHAVSWAALLSLACCAVPGTPVAADAQAPPAAGGPAPGAATGGEAQAIVLGSLPTAQEGEAWVKRWKEARYFHDDILRPKKGYPKIVRGEDLPGLDPGSHAVLLGICPGGDDGGRLEFVRSVFPGASTRAVSAPPEACPTMPRGRPTLVASRSIEDDGYRILANLYFFPQQEEGGAPPPAPADGAGRGPGSYRLKTASFDLKQQLLHHYAEERFFPAGDDSTAVKVLCKVALSGTSSQIVVDQTCDEPNPPACTGRTTHFVARTTYDFQGHAVREKTDVLEQRVSKLCD